MTHEWERFVWWLGQNAGAIQALSALATTMLTVALAATTIWYARLTHHGIRVNKTQLAAQYIPFLGISTDFNGEGDILIEVTNLGQYHLRIFHVSLLSRSSQIEHTLNKWPQFRIKGGSNESIKRTFAIPAGTSRDSLIVLVECSDLASFSGVYEYEFNVSKHALRSRELFGDWERYNDNPVYKMKLALKTKFFSRKSKFPPKYGFE